MLARDLLHPARDVEELLGARDLLEHPVLAERIGLGGDVGVVHEDERVGVEGDRVELVVDDPLLPHGFGEGVLADAELGEEVEVPGVEQAARSVAGDA